MNDVQATALVGSWEILKEHIMSVLPNVLAATLILLVGVVMAWTGGYAVERGLRIIRFDHLCDRMGLCAVLLRGGVKSDPSRLTGRSVYWAVALFASIAAISTLKLAPLNHFAQSLLAYVPRLATAAIILAAGYLLSNFVFQAALIASVNAALPPARIIAAASRWGVRLLAAAMALEQLGIAQNIVVVGFGITFGGAVFAAAIAFGLGAKDLARQFLEHRLGRGEGKNVDDLRHL